MITLYLKLYVKARLRDGPGDVNLLLCCVITGD